MRSSLPRFLLVGGTTVLVDFVVYQLLMLLGLEHEVAKTFSFTAGAVFAYVANWRFTFSGQAHRWSLALFVMIYAAALGLNVGANALVLHVLGEHPAWKVLFAFLVATGLSAVWNYIGMALFVFRAPRSSDTGARGVAPRHV